MSLSHLKSSVSNQPFLRKLQIRNYKSIASANMNLGSLNFLVGQNGSGKSNCLDCIRFVSESLRTSLDHALRDRGGIKEVRRKSGGHSRHFGIRMDFNLPNGGGGNYAFQIGSTSSGGFEVLDEKILINSGQFDSTFHVKCGEIIETTMKVSPAAVKDRLYLVAASGQPEFRPAFDALSKMEVYNLNPSEISAMQPPDPGILLRRDGSNAASILGKLTKEINEQINEYLSEIVPGISQPEVKMLGSRETVEFRQIVKGQKAPWHFYASSMSDGTLRAFGVLLALFQSVDSLLIGLEEPETALHPAAASVLLRALRKASEHTQVIVTSHSPDLLDDPDIDCDAIFAVDNDEGVTQIVTIDEAGKDALRNKLFTAGELLRKNQLGPDPRLLRENEQDSNQQKLFDFTPPTN